MNHEKIKVIPFNKLPLEERKKIIFYIESGRSRGMQQILAKLQNDIGSNQKRKINKYISDIDSSLQKEYEIIDNE